MPILGTVDSHVPASSVFLDPVDMQTTVPPGETVVHTMEITSTSDAIVFDDPHHCLDADNNPGIKVEVGGADELQTQFESIAFCLNAGETRTIELAQPTPDLPGEYELSFTADWFDPPIIWDSFNITQTVQEPVSPDAVTPTCSLPQSTVTEGDFVAASASVTNGNNEAVDVEIDIRVNGSTVSTESFTIQANDEFSFQAGIGSNLPVGSHSVSVALVSVNGSPTNQTSSCGTVTVEALDSGNGGSNGGGGDNGGDGILDPGDGDDGGDGGVVGGLTTEQILLGSAVVGGAVVLSRRGGN